MIKNNQSVRHFSYKNDTMNLVELGQFLRETTNCRVEREWWIVFDKREGHSGAYYYKNIDRKIWKGSRHPDLILIDKKTGIIKLIIELDGDIHRVKEFDTEQRNEDYKNAGIPLLVINQWEIDTTIFDYVTRKIKEMGVPA